MAFFAAGLACSGGSSNPKQDPGNSSGGMAGGGGFTATGTGGSSGIGVGGSSNAGVGGAFNGGAGGSSNSGVGGMSNGGAGGSSNSGVGGVSTGGAGGSFNPGTGGASNGGGAGSTNIGSGGACNGGAGGASDGGTGEPVFIPVSTGTFPFPGRWFGRLTDPNRAGSFVIHWNATDTVDRGLWTRSHRYGLAVTAGPENGTTLTSGAPEMKGCWTLYATADPDTLQVQPCDTPPSSGVPALGYFHRGARLIHPIQPPQVGMENIPPPKVTTVSSGGAGQWTVTAIDDRLVLWKNDEARAFDIGIGLSSAADISPDGQRVVYMRAGCVVGGPLPFVAYDTSTSSERIISNNGGTFRSGLLQAVGYFAADSRRFAFYENPGPVDFQTKADLSVYDFDAGSSVTLAPHIWEDALRSALVFMADSKRMLYTAVDPAQNGSNAPTFFARDLANPSAVPLGDAAELVGVPGGAFAAFRNRAGEVTLVDGNLTPTVLTRTVTQGLATTDAGFAPSPDGKKLAYVDGGRTLHVRTLADGSELTINDEASCFPSRGQNEPRLDLTPDRALAALFTSDGKAIVHATAGGCDANLGVERFARYDIASGLEANFTLASDFMPVYAVGPLGQIVISPSTFMGMLLLSWPGPSVPLETSTNDAFATGTKFTFSPDGRFLTYSVGGMVKVRDIPAGTTRTLSPDGKDPVITNPATSITVVWADNPVTQSGLTAFTTDGTPTVLSLDSAQPMANPSQSAVAFPISDAAGPGVSAYVLKPGAAPVLIGNGTVLTVTDTQVIFRDLDGVCSWSL